VRQKGSDAIRDVVLTAEIRSHGITSTKLSEPRGLAGRSYKRRFEFVPNVGLFCHRKFALNIGTHVQDPNMMWRRDSSVGIVTAIRGV
jgi:hypothetical protein